MRTKRADNVMAVPVQVFSEGASSPAVRSGPTGSTGCVALWAMKRAEGSPAVVGDGASVFLPERLSWSDSGRPSIAGVGQSRPGSDGPLRHRPHGPIIRGPALPQHGQHTAGIAAFLHAPDRTEHRTMRSLWPPRACGSQTRSWTIPVSIAALLCLPQLLGAATAEDAASVVSRLRVEEAPQLQRDNPHWHKPAKLLLLAQSNPALLAQAGAFAAVAPGARVVTARDRATAVAEAADADVIIGFNPEICDAQVIGAGRQLRWIASLSAGVELHGAASRPRSEPAHHQHARRRCARDRRACRCADAGAGPWPGRLRRRHGPGHVEPADGRLDVHAGPLRQDAARLRPRRNRHAGRAAAPASACTSPQRASAAAASPTSSTMLGSRRNC